MFFTLNSAHTRSQIRRSSQSRLSSTTVSKSCGCVRNSVIAASTSSRVAASGNLAQSISSSPSSVGTNTGLGACDPNVLFPMPGVP